MKLRNATIIFFALSQMVTASAFAAVTKDEFDSVINHAQTLFAPKVASALNAKLIIDGKWEDSTVNSFSQKFGDRYILNILGGIARHKLMTKDGLALVVCNELGHALGGKPKGALANWSSLAGQADYYTTAKCLKKVFENDDNRAIIQDLDIPVIVQKECTNSFKDNYNDFAICVRSTFAGIGTAELLNSISVNPPVSIDTPSTEVAETTNTSHPSYQCRLDTFFAGAVCKSNLNDDHDLDSGYCATGTAGGRPLCWFNPKN